MFISPVASGKYSVLSHPHSPGTGPLQPPWEKERFHFCFYYQGLLLGSWKEFSFPRQLWVTPVHTLHLWQKEVGNRDKNAFNIKSVYWEGFLPVGLNWEEPLLWFPFLTWIKGSLDTGKGHCFSQGAWQGQVGIHLANIPQNGPADGGGEGVVAKAVKRATTHCHGRNLQIYLFSDYKNGSRYLGLKTDF